MGIKSLLLIGIQDLGLEYPVSVEILYVQHVIIDLIFSLLKNRTVIIIAHRLSAVKRCDNIIVINNGRVTESGNHNELMEMQGEYYALYNAEI